MSRIRLLGAVIAVVSLVVDQGVKRWLLGPFALEERQPVTLVPGLDLVLAWNHGISYSLFTTSTTAGRLALLSVTLAATGALAVWLWRTRRPATAVALGLLIGGALGNAADRTLFGAVMDFVWIHAGRFSWYIFNGADIFITFGVVVLIYESFWRAEPARASKMP